MENAIHLGNNALTGQKIRIPFDELKQHWHFLGRTGKGKTKALEIFCRHIIDSQHGLVLLDGKGDLYEAVLKYCVASKYEDRVALIDPTNTEYATGINYLELLGDTDPATLAEMVTEGLKKCFGEEQDFKPLLEEWIPPSLLPLIHAGMTLAELEDIASIKDPSLRDATIGSLGKEGERLFKKWKEIKALGGFEAAIRTAVVRTRGALIRQSPMAEAMFGQVKTTINWRKVLDEGGIVLIRAHRHPKISNRLRQLIGVTVLHQLMETAFSRKEGERRDAWVVCDEFQQFACNDFVEGIVQLRSFHLWLVLANQELTQLKKIEGLRETVVGECTGKLYFSISHLDAEETVHELFQEDIHGNNIKDEIKQTKFRPVETTRTIESESHSDGYSESESYMDVSSSGEFIGSSSGFSEQYGPGWVIMRLPWNRTGSTWSEGESRRSSTSSSHSDGKSIGSSDSDSYGKSIVPWYEYREFEEVSSRTYYSVEEVLERLKRWLMIQHPRKAQLKVGDRKTLPIVTRLVEEIPVLEEEVQEFLNYVLPRCALPLEQVRKEIAERPKLYIEAYNKLKKEEEARAEKEAKDAEYETTPAGGEQKKPPALPPPKPKWEQSIMSVPEEKKKVRQRRKKP